MNPCEMPNVSFNTFAMGARQFVVQLALETILSLLGSKTSSFTPMQIVTSGSFAGALINTRFAPAFKCSSALSRLVNKPVDSRTTSISNFFPREVCRVAISQDLNFVTADDDV